MESLEKTHQHLITQVGIFVDVFRLPNQWAYVLRNSASGKPLYDDKSLKIADGMFDSYEEALRYGISAAQKYDERFIH